MADVNQTKAQTTNPVAANGAPTPAEPAKRAPRETPTIVCSPTKEEYAEIAKLVKGFVGDIDVKLPLGPFVLAHALKSIRATKKTTEAK